MEYNSSPARRIYGKDSNAANVTVGTGANTDILEIDTTQLSRVVAEIRNTGGQAFDAFAVLGKANPDGAYVTLLNVTADYTTPAGIVVDASGDLTVLASGATGWLILDVLGFSKIKFQASANVAGATTARIFVGAS